MFTLVIINDVAFHLSSAPPVLAKTIHFIVNHRRVNEKMLCHYSKSSYFFSVSLSERKRRRRNVDPYDSLSDATTEEDFDDDDEDDDEDEDADNEVGRG